MVLYYLPSSCASTPEEHERDSLSPFIRLFWYASTKSTVSMMWGLLGGVRRQEGSGADVLISLVSVSLVCSSGVLSFWGKRRALQELNSSRNWMEEGDGGDEGDRGKAPEVAEGDGHSWTAAGDKTT